MNGLIPKRFIFGVAIWAFIVSFTLSHVILYMLPTLLISPILFILGMTAIFYIIALTWYLMYRVDSYNPNNAWKVYILLIIFYSIMALIINFVFKI